MLYFLATSTILASAIAGGLPVKLVLPIAGLVVLLRRGWNTYVKFRGNGSGKMASLTKVDLHKGSLTELVLEFKKMVSIAQRRPDFFNLVDLCGATRASWHRTMTEWYLNRKLDLAVIKEMMLWTAASRQILAEAIGRFGEGQQKKQVIGMVENAIHRLKQYEILLNPDLQDDEKERQLREIAEEMESSQAKLASLCDSRGR